MDFIRKKMALFLTDEINRAIDNLDPYSPCAKALKDIDTDSVIKQDIDKLCNEITFSEVTKILSITNSLKNSLGEKQQNLKKQLREIIDNIIERVEKKTGKLNIPEACRQMLVNPVKDDTD